MSEILINTACNLITVILAATQHTCAGTTNNMADSLEPAIIALVTRGVVQLEFKLDYME